MEKERRKKQEKVLIKLECLLIVCLLPGMLDDYNLLQIEINTLYMFHDCD